MMIFYVIYCIALHFNGPLERWAYTLQLPIKLPTKEEQSALVTFKNLPDTSYSQSQAVTSLTQEPEPVKQPAESNYQDYNQDPNASWDPNAAWDSEQPSAPTQPAATTAPTSTWDPNSSWTDQSTGQQNYGYSTGAGDQTGADSPPAAPKAIVTTTTTGGINEPEYYKSKDMTNQVLVNPLERPPPEAGVFALISWRVVYPIHYMCRLTMPDCRTEKYKNWYAFTFFMSMIWISFYSYFMVSLSL